MSTKNMTVVDLFSGCGGFSEGFYFAGFEIICAIDHWGTARNSIAFNHGQEVIPRAGKKYNYDIERISKLPNHEFNKIIPDSEIIIGSPPCVSFFEIGDGVIEVDLKGRNEPGRSFVGIDFHGINAEKYEVVYLRPFNFKAESEVRRSHSMQYVLVPSHEWNRLRTDSDGMFANLKVNTK